MRSVDDMYQVVLEKDRQHRLRQRRLLVAGIAGIVLVAGIAMAARRAPEGGRVVDTANATVSVDGTSSVLSVTTLTAPAPDPEDVSTTALGEPLPDATSPPTTGPSNPTTGSTATSVSPSSTPTTSKVGSRPTTTGAPAPDTTTVATTAPTSTTSAPTATTTPPVANCDATDVSVDVSTSDPARYNAGDTIRWTITGRHNWNRTCRGPALNQRWVKVVDSHGSVVYENHSEQAYNPPIIFGIYDNFDFQINWTWDTACAAIDRPPTKCSVVGPGTYSMTASTFGGVSQPLPITIVNS